MRAVVLESYGGPEVLTLQEVPDPVHSNEEVLIDISTTALNRADLLQRMGFYPSPPMDQEIPGMEYSGVVSAVGKWVQGFKVGDHVMGIVGGGGYAEKIAVHERQVMAVPSTVPVADAAAIPEVWITAFDALVAQAGLTSGMTALVHAGASGVGTAAIQIAKAIGANIAVTASSGKVQACRDLGADLAIDYNAEDYVAAVNDFTGGLGAHVILDVVGGDYLGRNLKCVRNQGTIIQVGLMGGGNTEVDLGRILTGRLRLIGTVLRPRPLEQKAAITQRFATEMLPLFESGVCKPVIDTRFPLDAIADAQAHMEANANVGKILIDVG